MRLCHAIQNYMHLTYMNCELWRFPFNILKLQLIVGNANVCVFVNILVLESLSYVSFENLANNAEEGFLVTRLFL